MDEDDVSFTLTREEVSQSVHLEDVVEKKAEEIGYYVLDVRWAAHIYNPKADELMPKRRVIDQDEEFPLFDTPADVEGFVQETHHRVPGGTLFVAHVAASPDSDDFNYYCYGFLNRIE